MANDMNDIAQTAQRQILDSLQALQSTVLESARALADIVDSVVPAKFRGVEVPRVDGVPSPQEAVNLGFDFVEQVMSSQRKFVSELASIQLGNSKRADKAG